MRVQFSTFFHPKISFSNQKIWDILYIENINLVVHLSSLHFQLYKDIWFVEVWQKLLSFDFEMVLIYQYMNM